MKNDDQAFIVEQIRTKYTEKECTSLEKLKQLDKKVEKPAKVFAFTFGIIASLVFGTGLCLVLGAIEGGITLGVIIGTVGLGLCGLNYTLFCLVLEKRKKKYAKEILRLSDELLKN